MRIEVELEDKREILAAPPHRGIVGLDLSLRRPGVCGLSGSWSPVDPWANVDVEAFPEVKDTGSKRLLRITQGVEGFVEKLAGDPRRPPAVFVEQHAFGMAGGSFALERAELVGAVKVMVLRRWGVEVIPIVASSARKLLFGPQRRMSTREWKPFIHASFREMGAPGPWGEDERDAFVIANAGRHLLGAPCLASG